jgi:hypothetical protein
MIVSSNNSSNDGGSTESPDATLGPLPGGDDGTPATPPTAPVDAQADTSVTQPDASVTQPETSTEAPDASDADACTFICGRMVCGATPCDPRAYEGGSGSCDPRWVSGNGCTGGDVLYPCGLSVLVPDGGPLPTLTAAYCLGAYYNWVRVVVDGGVGAYAPTLEAGTSPLVLTCAQDCTGRRPAALAGEPPAVAATLGGMLARAAYLEAASITAFLELAAQLEALGAPKSLVSRTRRAARDEVRHARTMRTLAEAHGGVVPVPQAVPSAVIDPLAIALLNAHEGCVRETWGAAVALVQSRKTSDPALRRAMTRIARDELAHAALSWDIGAWLEQHLTGAQRAWVDTRRSRAIAELRAEIEIPVPEDLRIALGLPGVDEARAMLDAMQTELWSAAA